jgi:hypothetical protein
MKDIETNLATLDEMVSILKAFLLSDELYWPLQSKELRGSQRVSLGTLLLILDELGASEPRMTVPQRSRFDGLHEQFDGIFNEWRIAVTKKAEREIRMRANLWRSYLQDLEENHDQIHAYAREVRNRVIMVRLSELVSDEPIMDFEDVKLRRLESQQQITKPDASFVWDEHLRATYPFETYPFLYR